MDGLSTPPSPSRRPQRGRGQGANGARSSRGRQPRQRGQRGRSLLSSAKPINQSDLENAAQSPLSNGVDTESESADESDTVSRGVAFGNVNPENRYEELKVKREQERKRAVAQGLVDDPDNPRPLSEAIRFVGTCQTMCPEFEMHQREFQNNVEKWEIDPETGRISQARAVKAFHRPAAGNEAPLPSDVRAPSVLVKTLDYLFGTILEGGEDIYATHAFIRDRTRSIRQDFTLQNYRGKEAIDCHERIARYHILCLHALCDNPNFSEQQEMEQLRKVLQSLMEFYKDNKTSLSPIPLPNEVEFRVYYGLVFLNDNDVLAQLQALPEDVFLSSAMTRALRLRSLAQRSNHKSTQSNAEAAQNSFSRFFKQLKYSATFLEACVLETWFGSIRTGAFKAMRQALGVKALQISQVPFSILVNMMGFDGVDQLVAFCQYLGLEMTTDANGVLQAVWFQKSVPWEEPSASLHQFSKSIVDVKRGTLSNQAIVNGAVQATPIQPALKRKSIGPEVKKAPAPLFVPPARKENIFGTPQVNKNPIPSFAPPTKPPALAFDISKSFAPLQQQSPPIPPISFNSETKQPPLSPTPKRAMKSPVLGFSASETPIPIPKPQSVTFVFKSPHPSPSSFPPNTSASTISPPAAKPIPPLAKAEEKQNLRKELFERQEALLKDELAKQNHERTSHLNTEEQQRQQAEDLANQLVQQRELIRQSSSTLLQQEKASSEKQEREQRTRAEKRKIEVEKQVTFHTEEIVNVIVQQHLLEVEAEALALEFRRRKLLFRVVRHLKKVSSRAKLRRQLKINEIAEVSRRRRTLARALVELDYSDLGGNARKKARRISKLPRFEDEDALEESLIRASEESQELWRPLELQPLLVPYVDFALAGSRTASMQWDLLILSVQDNLGDKLKWLRTKFGLVDDNQSRVVVPSEVAEVQVVWSPVMKFTGKLDNIGALIFLYEGEADSITRDILFEVVRHISLQSRYRAPVLIINFNDAVSNASEVASKLDLQALSQLTSSIPAFQVLMIGELAEVDLEISLHSFLRHVTGIPNDSLRDKEEKKRKRLTMDGSLNGDIETSFGNGIQSPNKAPRLENGNISLASGGSQNLSKSVASLYQSILSAEEELEAGKRWNEELLD